MENTEGILEKLEYMSKQIQKIEINLKKCPKARLTEGYLEICKTNAEQYWAKYKEGHENLLMILKKADRATIPHFKENWYDECETIYTNLIADILDRLMTMQQSIQDVQPSTYAPEMKMKNTNIDVKLPKISLPSYSGLYEEWQSFEDSFVSLIHNHTSLSDIQKLHYLKSCLTGEAQNTIKHFQITEKNYSAAWDTLKSRYSHRRLIVNAIMKKLFTAKKMNVQSTTQLKYLIDNTKECLNSLNALDVKTSSWDPILIFLSVQKLDQETHRDWEDNVSRDKSVELPKCSSLITFLEDKIRTLELTSPSATVSRDVRVRTYYTTEGSDETVSAAASTLTSSKAQTCVFCNGPHIIHQCKDFEAMTAEDRCELAKQKRLCFNCLKPGHAMFCCSNRLSCRLCGKRHHTLIHTNKGREEFSGQQEGQPGVSSMHTNIKAEVDVNNEPDITIASHFTSKKGKMRALLATAIVHVKNDKGQVVILRALIDSGSQATFISERATQLLQAKRTAMHGSVTGIGSSKVSINQKIQLEISSMTERDYKLNVEAYVLPTPVTSKLPCKNIEPKQEWVHLNGLTLADPQYFTPGKIDLLLGIEVYTQIVKNNLIKGPKGTPCAQETHLGWILFGDILDEQCEEELITAMHSNLEVEMDNILRNMWEIDQSNKRNFTSEERRCEEFYEKTHTRSADGLYVVRLPFKGTDPTEQIGDTKQAALQRFRQLERKFQQNPKFKEEYTKVIQEYIDLGHMEEVPEEEQNNPKAVYLPHHAVLKEDRETTQCRVVFDASCKGTKQRSLNDELMVGPQLQEDLRSLVMRWRTKPYCFVADVTKMYRCIRVAQEDADYQRIFWKVNDDLKEYRMLRVTFGTASAPYLAVKTLMQVAHDEGHDKTDATRTIKEDFFVDDCMTGAMTKEACVRLGKEVHDILQSGGFRLHKFASNSKEFLNAIPTEKISAKANLNVEDSTMKTLGISWNMSTDTFRYQMKLPDISTDITKRNILADLQRLFDPLGWLGAAIITAKIFVQRLWIERLDWDETINDELRKEWLMLRESFNEVDKIIIPRWIHTDNEEMTNITLHGFCDASNNAYCAVVYSRTETKEGFFKTALIACKTRVTPVKPVSIPRLELCGAVLLAKLLTQVRDAMRIQPHNVYAWTDSAVVLSWIFGDPNRWKPFVSNRVVEILDNTCNTQWFHVSSKDNPADIGSRGVGLAQLLKNKMWWEGPEWLQGNEIKYSRPNVIPTDIERKNNIQANTSMDAQETGNHLEIFDTLQEMQKGIAYCVRFLQFKRNPVKLETKMTTAEYEDALERCIRIVQREEFPDEIQRLTDKGYVRCTSSLKSLNPYLDEKNILRVGGRLRNADLNEMTKHPIVLGTNNHLTKLILADAHKKTLHGGVQQMICYIRTKYWIIRLKSAVRAQIHKCLICARQRAQTKTQMMGDLPKVRVTQARSFLHSGVDFAGPIQVLMSRGRGAKTNKAYIAVFVCMATKALHLELVGDLSSEAFIGAFQRFVARRGRCTHLWSDQGRNFVGANKELAAAFESAQLELPGEVAEKLALDGTQWHFIPAYSPNFGGLWEAGVKSVKHHLKRVLTGNLTFEEMSTVLCQVEACLNSRPLIPLDPQGTEDEPLTPGHFLIGEAPVSIPTPDLRDINVNRLSRWQHTQKIIRDFWHRWQSEYLSRLQERPKWIRQQQEFKIADIVLIKDEALPPGKWLMGRIIEKHPGTDGITRVYSVKCGSNVIKRSVSKLCWLPVDTSD